MKKIKIKVNGKFKSVKSDNKLSDLIKDLKIPVNKIGLKATTSEKIGIIGKNQAIAVQSIVNLRDKK